MIDTNSKGFNNLVAQLAHFGYGALIVAIFTIFVPVKHAGAYGWLAVMAYSIPKEFIWDKYMEGQPFLNNAIDALLYWAGAAAVGIPLIILHRL